MEKIEILNLIEQLFGSVPDWIKETPESDVKQLWIFLEKYQVADITAIPPKYKELISLAVAAAVQCRYCNYYHSEVAKLNGASEEEIRETILLANLVNHPPI
jgi:AhpD family alkylhydroperoxidase